jgi:hypothetical protein
VQQASSNASSSRAPPGLDFRQPKSADVSELVSVSSSGMMKEDDQRAGGNNVLSEAQQVGSTDANNAQFSRQQVQQQQLQQQGQRGKQVSSNSNSNNFRNIPKPTP